MRLTNALSSSTEHPLSVAAGFFLASIGCLSTIFTNAVGVEPPVMLFQQSNVHDSTVPSGNRTSVSLLRLPNNVFAFYDNSNPNSEPLSLPDRHGKLHALQPFLPSAISDDRIVSSRILANSQVIQTQRGKLISVFVRREEASKEELAKAGLHLFLNVWAQEADSQTVSEPKMIWRGYNGSQMEYEQLASGRILVPFGSLQPNSKAVPPLGRHRIVVQYSDDEGQTWHESPTKLSSPCYDGFNGSNEGACEPAIEQLKDGRIWMLFRTQAGFLYESYSEDSGTTWKPATASRFHTSTGPPNIMRHRDGYLVVCWNNCEMPPRADGAGVYGGRDALHIAISHDEGRSWQGFREIYLDYRRNDNPSKSGDRGTAYPLAGYTQHGQIVVVAGQGAGGRNVLLIDPEWITQREVAVDFSKGLQDWSVYKHFGPAKSWWRARAVGCELVDDPNDEDQKVLHVRRLDDISSDRAVWNFPNAYAGTLTTRLWLHEGSQGGSISLNDRMFDPSNDDGERLAVLRVDFHEKAKQSESSTTAALTPGVWHNLEIKWDLLKSEASVRIDNQTSHAIQIRNPSLNGVSYIRFCSSAASHDESGFLVGPISVSIQNPYTPALTPQQIVDHEQRYIENVVRTWR